MIVSFNLLLDGLESEIAELIKKTVKSSVDRLLLIGYKTALAKMDEYYDKLNWIYCVVLFLDPRHKKETFNMTSWGRGLLDRSYEKFEIIYESYKKQYSDPSNEKKVVNSKKKSCRIDFNQLYVKPSGTDAEMSELDSYFGNF